MRTILVLVVLVVAGWGFVHLTQLKAAPVAVNVVESPSGKVPVKIRLTFSGVAGDLELKSGDEIVALPGGRCEWRWQIFRQARG